MIFGIDFGTTNTVVSYVNEANEVVFLTNDIQELTNIQLKTLNKTAFVAKKQLQAEEFNQTRMFSVFNDFNAQDEDNSTKLFLTQTPNLSNIKREIANNSVRFKQGKTDVYFETYEFFKSLFEKIKKQFDIKTDLIPCVITVPVRFDDIAKNAIKAAAIKANFNVLKLLLEPVAAAIKALNDKKTQNGYYLVYDLGGGTFDLSLLKKNDDIYQVVAVDGMADFGGIDIDYMIMKKLRCSIREAVRYKHIQQYTDEIIYFMKKMLKPTYELVEKILKENEVKQLNSLILIGGSSNLPFIFEELSEKYKIIKTKDLQTQVSEGAAIHANDLNKKNHTLIDVIPFNLGIEVANGKMEVLIPKNSPLPFLKTETFQPISDKVVINILQGIEEDVEKCISLKKLIIEHDKDFEVSFYLDYNGILSVKFLDEVIVISQKLFAHFNEYIQELEMMIKAVENLSMNEQQQKIFNLLKQAKENTISNEAFKFLKNQYLNVFK